MSDELGSDFWILPALRQSIVELVQDDLPIVGPDDRVSSDLREVHHRGIPFLDDAFPLLDLFRSILLLSLFRLPSSSLFD